MRRRDPWVEMDPDIGLSIGDQSTEQIGGSVIVGHRLIDIVKRLDPGGGEKPLPFGKRAGGDSGGAGAIKIGRPLKLFLGIDGDREAGAETGRKGIRFVVHPARPGDGLVCL